MSFQTLAEGLVLVACVLGALTLIGLPLRLALQTWADDAITVPTPLLGIGVVVVVGWYWYSPFGGVRPLAIGLMAIGAVVGTVDLIRRWSGWRAAWAAATARLGLAVAVSVGVFLVLLVAWGSLFSGPSMVNAVGGNADMANYAMIGQHVADEGPDVAGPVVGNDIGARAQSSFDFGSLAVVAATAVGPFGDVYRYQMPLSAVVVGIIAYVIAGLLGRLAPDRRGLTWLGGVAAICPILFAYLWSYYFLNELLAIALVLAACVAIVHGAARPTTRSRLAHGAAAAITLAPLLASYPHMALAGPLVLVPALFFSGGVARLGPRLGRLALQGIGVLAVAMLLLPTLAWRLPDALRDLSNVDAGWPLPGFLPSEILGFVSTTDPRHDSVVEWVPSIVILAVVLGAAVWLVRARHAPALGRFAIVLFPLALASYWYAYQSAGGPSYRQWKWITFFTPLLVGTAVVVVMVSVAVLVRRLTERPERFALAACVAYCVVASVNSGTVGFAIGSTGPGLEVTNDLTTLGTNPGLAGIEELNVAVNPFWETVWVSYFLRDRTALRLQGSSAFVESAPAPGWTLQHRGAPTDGALEVRPVNATFELVRR
jgi:hypothetical protein